MRLATDLDRDEARAHATIHAALDGGIRVFDTAHAYGHGAADLGLGERWLGAALASHARGGDAVVITKGGMARPEGRWLPDGRATTLRSDCQASLAALGRPIDLYLIHAPDPRVRWATTVRALGRLLADGLVRAVGVSNVNLAQLDEALALAPLAAVEVGWSAIDDLPLRAGVVARCRERGLVVVAHSPLGGPRRAGKLLVTPLLVTMAARYGVTPAALALAALVDGRNDVVPIPGARRPEAARAAAEAATLTPALTADDRALLAAELPGLRRADRRARVATAAGTAEGVTTAQAAGTTTAQAAAGVTAARAAEGTTMARASAGTTTAQPSAGGTAAKVAEGVTAGRAGEVVVLMGIPGAGKSAAVAAYVDDGYERLNRDMLRGSLSQLAARLDERLAGGVSRVVLDNTYVTRAARAELLDVAAKYGVAVRGVWLETPVAEAQVNLVWRMLDAHGRLLAPEELRRGRDPTALAPTALFRLLRTVEPPGADEGFAQLERIPFVRRPRATGGGKTARFVALEVAGEVLRDRAGDGLRDPAGAGLRDPAGAGLRDPVADQLRDPAGEVRATFVFGWAPAATVEAIAGWEVAHGVPVVVCVHGGGPPVCWCRPPLPGLLVALAYRHGLALAGSEVWGRASSRAHQALAAAVGARFVAVGEAGA
jgi:aryl-alcohol dehydrogenase-like predicted oxidoreductase